MFKSTRELKAFISWAKKNGARRVAAGGVEVEFSEIPLAAEAQTTAWEKAVKDSGLDLDPVKEMNLDGSKVFADDKQEDNDDETLFWSSPTYKG